MLQLPHFLVLVAQLLNILSVSAAPELLVSDTVRVFCVLVKILRVSHNL
jgi:hypothetical protein